MTLEEFVDQNENIVIYGAGSIAQRFYGDLVKKGLDYKVIGFGVTKSMEYSGVMGKPVKGILEYPKEYGIAIAVHNVIYDEMRLYLEHHEYSKYYWVFPELFDFHYGKPVVKDALINVRKLVKSIENSYSHVVYLLAIEEVATGNNSVGIGLYNKYMRSFCNKSTADKRKESFINRINNYLADDSIEQFNIKVNSKRTFVLDGAHRLMLAYFFQKETIGADVYETQDEEYLFLGKCCLTKERLQSVYSQEEVEIVESKYREILI